MQRLRAFWETRPRYWNSNNLDSLRKSCACWEWTSRYSQIGCRLWQWGKGARIEGLYMPGLPCNLFSTLQLLLSGAELTLVRAVFLINQTSILHQFQRQLATFYSTFLVVDLTSGGPISSSYPGLYPDLWCTSTPNWELREFWSTTRCSDLR